MKLCRIVMCGVLLWVIAALNLGCGTSRPAPDKTTQHASRQTGPRLELNHGRKWVVDKPMMGHIRHLAEAVRAQDQPRSATEHKALATLIQDDLGLLVTNCTMEGKAHDELHKWLMPFLGLSAEYARLTDATAQNQMLVEIERSLDLFDIYFE